MKAGKCHKKLSRSTICWLTESFPCKRGSRLTSAPHGPTTEFCSASPHLYRTPFGDRRPCWTWRAEGKSQDLRLAAVSRTAAREGENPGATASWRKLEVEDEIGERGALNSSCFGPTNFCQEVSKGWCDFEQCQVCVMLWRELVWSRTQEPVKVPLFGQEMCCIGCKDGMLHQNLNLPSVRFGISLGDTILTKDLIWSRIFV